MDDISGVGIGLRQNTLTHATFDIVLNETVDRSLLYELVDRVS